MIPEKDIDTVNDINILVREFLRYLDIQERSDEGKLFHPTYLSSCRVLDGIRCNKILLRMKELSKGQYED